MKPDRRSKHKGRGNERKSRATRLHPHQAAQNRLVLDRGHSGPPCPPKHHRFRIKVGHSLSLKDGIFIAAHCDPHDSCPSDRIVCLSPRVGNIHASVQVLGGTSQKGALAAPSRPQQAGRKPKAGKNSQEQGGALLFFCPSYCPSPAHRPRPSHASRPRGLCCDVAARCDGFFAALSNRIGKTGPNGRNSVGPGLTHNKSAGV